MATKIFISAGEPSGDHHGAQLVLAMRETSPEIEISGFGGPLMRSAGQLQLTDLTQFTVFGVVDALKKFPKFTKILRQAKAWFRDPNTRPDAVVVIDYPGFHWELAKIARRNGIPVYYFVSPQIWAWATWRTRKMRRLIRRTFCSLPFEESWLRQRGCDATYVGHPFFDAWHKRTLDENFLRSIAGTEPLITILPGSRDQEVRQNTECFLHSAQKISRAIPGVRFAVAAFRKDQAAWIQHRIEELPEWFPITVYTGRTPELIASAKACMACSGSISLELLAAHCPTVIHYRIGRGAYRIQRYLRRTRYITLVNLLVADRLESTDTSPYDPKNPKDANVLFPEYLTDRDVSDQVANHLIEWLTNTAAYDEVVAKLTKLYSQIIGAIHLPVVAWQATINIALQSHHSPHQ